MGKEEDCDADVYWTLVNPVGGWWMNTRVFLARREKRPIGPAVVRTELAE